MLKALQNQSIVTIFNFAIALLGSISKLLDNGKINFHGVLTHGKVKHIHGVLAELLLFSAMMLTKSLPILALYRYSKVFQSTFNLFSIFKCANEIRRYFEF
ncbi:hypothetical protein ADICYQ_2210 [Cyclobacterium qasimii M12-11B]|uniref:Uncharacterized protein n=1 Tax=Cyclobacterium qasimii M12-11B TaxID=641524 RepID=S7WPY6_9BACT|nr:hypothetical protein ADICYQ_2210 [Cyclobacterium qasimii M12-11B]